MTAREAAEGLRKALESLRYMPTPPRWDDSEGGPFNAVDCAEQATAAALVVLDAQSEREAELLRQVEEAREMAERLQGGIATTQQERDDRDVVRRWRK